MYGTAVTDSGHYEQLKNQGGNIPPRRVLYSAILGIISPTGGIITPSISILMPSPILVEGAIALTGTLSF